MRRARRHCWAAARTQPEKAVCFPHFRFPARKSNDKSRDGLMVARGGKINGLSVLRPCPRPAEANVTGTLQ